jgi:hypothetical protein
MEGCGRSVCLAVGSKFKQKVVLESYHSHGHHTETKHHFRRRVVIVGGSLMEGWSLGEVDSIFMFGYVLDGRFILLEYAAWRDEVWYRR